MGQVLHGSATTTEAIRRAIQNSQESLRALAKRYGINQKTVAKWKKRTSVADLSDRSEGAEVDGAVARGRGGHRRLSQAYAAAARRLPLCAAADDPASDALVTASLPAAPWHLAGCRMSRATSRPRRSSRAYPIGYFHIDIAEVQTAEGKLYLFVAIDRTSKFAYARTCTRRQARWPQRSSCAT